MDSKKIRIIFEAILKQAIIKFLPADIVQTVIYYL